MDASTIVSQIRYHSAIMGNYALQFMPTGGGKNRTLVCKTYVKRARAYAISIKTETFLTYWQQVHHLSTRPRNAFFSRKLVDK
jgi:hypothetical protein